MLWMLMAAVQLENWFKSRYFESRVYHRRYVTRSVFLENISIFGVIHQTYLLTKCLPDIYCIKSVKILIFSRLKAIHMIYKRFVYIDSTGIEILMQD